MCSTPHITKKMSLALFVALFLFSTFGLGEVAYATAADLRLDTGRDYGIYETSACGGETLSGTMTVINGGSASTPRQSWIQLYLHKIDDPTEWSRDPMGESIDWTGGSEDLGERFRMASVTPGNGQIFSISEEIPSDIEAGYYVVYYYIDYYDNVPGELSESNNRGWLPGIIDICAGSGGSGDPDFSIHTCDEFELQPDGDISFDCRIENTTDVDFIGDIDTDFYLTTSRSTCYTDYFVATEEETNVYARDDDPLTINGTIDYTLPSDTYYICAVVDPSDRVDEDRESNNIFIMPEAYELSFGEGEPDFSVHSCDSSVTIAGDGRTVSFACRIENTTDVDFVGDIYTDFYFTPSPTECHRDYFIGTEREGDVAARDDDSLTIDGVIDYTLPYNTYWICAVVDPDDDVSEVEEDNNIFITPTSYTLAIPDVSDIGILDINIYSPTSVSYRIGDTVGIRGRVVNTGALDYTDTEYNLFLRDTTTGATTNLIGEFPSTIDIPAGDDRDRTVYADIPVGVADGTYYLGFEFIGVSDDDPFNNIIYTEGSEYITIDNSPIVDVTVSSVSIENTELSYAIGANVDVELLILSDSTEAHTGVGYTLTLEHTETGETFTMDSLAPSTIATINPSSSNPREVSGRIPSGVSPGTYRIIFQLDASDMPGDDSSDNTGTSDNIMTIGGGATGVDFDVINCRDFSFSSDGTVDFDCDIENVGVSDYADRVHTDFYFTTSPSSCPTTYFIAREEESFIDAGETKLLTINGTIDYELPEDTYYICAIVDPDERADEDREDNNVFVFPETYDLSFAITDPEDPTDPPPYEGYFESERIFFGISDPTETDYNLAGLELELNYMRLFTDLIQGNEIADPVNSRTGSFELQQKDYELAGRGFPLTLGRTYNSKMHDWHSRFGAGWSFSYDGFVYQDPETGVAHVALGSDVAVLFSPDGGGGFTPPAGVAATLTKADTNTWTFTTQEQIRYQFTQRVDSDYLTALHSITDTFGNTTAISYRTLDGTSVPVVDRVTDPSGRALQFTYGTGDPALLDTVVRVEEVGMANPRRIDYAYEISTEQIPLLTSVTETRTFDTASEDRVTRYTYDSNHRLTSYEDARGTIVRNAYDEEGRVVTQEEHNPRIDAAGAFRTLFAFTYTDGREGVPTATRCTETTFYASETEHFTTVECFNDQQMKVYKEDGRGIDESWTHDANGMVTTYTDARGGQTQYTYDSRRRLTSEQLPDIDVQTRVEYTYEDTFNKLTERHATIRTLDGLTVLDERMTRSTIDGATGSVNSHTDAMGATEYFFYDTHGNVITSRDKRGVSTTYTYDADGNYLVEQSVLVTDYDGASEAVTTRYGYNEYGYQTSMTTPRGHAYTYEYDSDGNLREEHLPDGNTRTHVYDIEGHLISSTNERGVVSTFVYDTDIQSSLLSESVHGADTITRTYAYDWLGRTVQETDPNGNVTQFVYNHSNQVEQVIDPYRTTTHVYSPTTGDRMITWDDADRRTEFLYNNRGDLIRTEEFIASDDSAYTRIGLDGWGQTVSSTDPRGRVTRYAYDALGRMTTTTDALGNSTIQQYDPNGNKTHVYDANGNRTQYRYDELNRLIATTYADGATDIISYDADGNVERTIDRVVGGDRSHRTQFVYNNRGHQTAQIDALGNTTTFAYDAVGNLLTATSPEGVVTTYTYDSFNRETAISDGRATATTAYDANGNVVEDTDAAGARTTYVYDAHNRMTQKTNPDSGVWQYTYDGADNLTEMERPDGSTVQYIYDDLGRVTRETDSLGTRTDYSYLETSPVLEEVVTNSEGEEMFRRTNTYDDLDRLIRTVQGGDIESWTYDAVGNIMTHNLADEAIQTYEYDELNRVDAREDSDGTTVYARYEFRYDPWSNLQTVNEQDHGCPCGDVGIPEAGRNVYWGNYDVLNRNIYELFQTKETFNEYGITGLTVIRSYDADNRLVFLVDPSGRTSTYTYDTYGALSNVAFEGESLATYSYDTAGRLHQTTFGNGLVTEYEYDEMSRTNDIETIRSGDTQVLRRSYVYDTRGNRDTEQDHRGVTFDYTYDTESQLIGYDILRSLDEVPGSTHEGIATYSFGQTYDALGNRLSQDTPHVDATYGYDSSNKYLVDLQYDSGLYKTYSYKSGGWLEAEESYAEGRHMHSKAFEWQGNRLLRITQTEVGLPEGVRPDPAVTAFRYDFNGNRTAKHNGDEWTFYINDGTDVVATIHQSGDLVKTYVRGIGAVAEVAGDGTVEYVHTDPVGTVLGMTNEAGELVAEYDMDPFGVTLGLREVAGSGSSFTFTGQEQDRETGLQYFGLRYYNPDIGRFISSDPVWARSQGGIFNNTFTYVRNNPFKYTDPTGGEEEVIVGIAQQFSSKSRHRLRLMQRYGANPAVPALMGALTVADIYGYSEQGSSVRNWLYGASDWIRNQTSQANKVKEGTIQSYFGDSTFGQLLAYEQRVRSFGNTIKAEIVGGLIDAPAISIDPSKSDSRRSIEMALIAADFAGGAGHAVSAGKNGIRGTVAAGRSAASVGTKAQRYTSIALSHSDFTDESLRVSIEFLEQTDGTIANLFKRIDNSLAGFHRRRLNSNLGKAGVHGAKGTHAHHIVPIRAKGFEDARSTLRKFDLDINNAANGVYLQEDFHTSVHKSKDYTKYVNAYISEAKSQQDVIRRLQDIESQLSNQQIPR